MRPKINEGGFALFLNFNIENIEEINLHSLQLNDEDSLNILHLKSYSLLEGKLRMKV